MQAKAPTTQIRNSWSDAESPHRRPCGQHGQCAGHDRERRLCGNPSADAHRDREDGRQERIVRTDLAAGFVERIGLRIDIDAVEGTVRLRLELVGDVEVAVAAEAERGEQVLRFVGGDTCPVRRVGGNAEHRPQCDDRSEDQQRSSHPRVIPDDRPGAAPAATSAFPTRAPARSRRDRLRRGTRSSNALHTVVVSVCRPMGASRSVAGSSLIVESSTSPPPATQPRAHQWELDGAARAARAMHRAAARTRGRDAARSPQQPRMSAWPAHRSGSRTPRSTAVSFGRSDRRTGR